MKVVVVSASPRKTGKTQIIMKYVFDYAKTKDTDVTLINLAEDNIEYYRGYDVKYNETTTKAAEDLMSADVWLLGTPIYNSFFSAALKNLFEYVSYKKTEGKVAGITILASGNIGFTNVQTLLTQLLSYFRVITNPKAVFLTVDSINDDLEIDDESKCRLNEMVDDTLRLAEKIRR